MRGTVFFAIAAACGVISLSMARRPWKPVMLVACAGAVPAWQQQAPSGAPQFDVVSIHAVPPDSPPMLREWNFTPVLPGGQYSDPRTTLFSMIAFAYEVKNPSTQLVGLPDWAKNTGYVVAAKPAPGFPALPPAENREQVRLMMRAMLADRFHLQLHTETRQDKIYNLEVAKGGFKFKEVDPPESPAKAPPIGAVMGDEHGRIAGTKSTMADFAGMLAAFLRRPVIDRTGLKGYYDFDVKWSAPETSEGTPRSPGFGAEGIALLMPALEHQFGLQLTSAAGPVEYWVVDHVERPTSN